jgi:ElaB/YqjD/DUF883 family membrane-anchored ribosome-binding protein
MAAFERLKCTCSQVERDASTMMRATDELIRRNPYASVGIAFGVGLLLGVLVNRD